MRNTENVNQEIAEWPGDWPASACEYADLAAERTARVRAENRHLRKQVEQQKEVVRELMRVIEVYEDGCFDDIPEGSTPFDAARAIL